MPLFAISQMENLSRNVMVKADTLSSLVEKAARKLGFSGEYASCKVVLQKNGIEIDEDEVLLEYADRQRQDEVMELILLKPDQEWFVVNAPSTPANAGDAMSVDRAIDTDILTSDANGTPQRPRRLDATSTSPRNLPVPPEPALPTPASRTPNTNTHPIPWDQFPEEVKEAMQEKRHLSPRERRELNKILSSYICSVLRDTRFDTVKAVCTEIAGKKPNTFVETIGGKTSGTGCENWTRKLYYAVQFKKSTSSDDSLRPKKRAKRSRPVDVSAAASSGATDDAAEEAAEDDPEAVPLPEKLDSHGCVLWKPQDLPPGETIESQEKLRNWLYCNFRFRDSEDDPEVEDAMRKTYHTQRGDIVRRRTLLEPVLKEWPFLRVPKYFLQHASTLLSKNIVATWNESLEQKREDLLKFLASACTARKKKAASAAQKMRLESMSEEIKKAKQSCTDLNSQAPKTTLLFPLLALYFRDSFEDLVKLEPTMPTSEKLLQGASHPYVIVVGRSLYEEKPPVIRVIIEQTTFMELETVSEAILSCFCSYYVFGLLYPTTIDATLEFIQRVLLSYNPDSGNKRHKGKKRGTTPTTVHPLVQSFVEKFEEF